jgi:hypothetical protein
MQKRRVFLGQDFRGVVCACIALTAIAGGSSFAQSNSIEARGRDGAEVRGQIARPQRPVRPGLERLRPDLEEVRRQKRDIRENARTEAAVALPIKTLDDRKIAQQALREERARIREELKAHGSTQQQRIEEVRQEAHRRIAEAKAHGRHSRE